MSDTIEMVLCTRCGKGCYDHRSRDGEVLCLTCVETEADEALDGAQDLIAHQRRRVEELEGVLRRLLRFEWGGESVTRTMAEPWRAAVAALTPSPAEPVKPGAGDTWCGARRFGAQCALHAGHDGPHDSVPMGIFRNTWRDPEPPTEPAEPPAPTPEEARAYLEENGVDVDAFMGRVWQTVREARAADPEPPAEQRGGERLDAIFPVTMGDGVRMLPVEVTVAITDWMKRWVPDLVGVDEAGGTLLLALNETLQAKLPGGEREGGGFRCASPVCPGYPWPASERPHPCPPTTPQEPAANLNRKEKSHE